MIWIDQAMVLRMGWTLVHFLWQGAVLAGVLALILWSAKGQTSRLRYGLACSILMAMAIAPVATWYRLGLPQAANRVDLKPSTRVAPALGSTATVEPVSQVQGTGTPGRTWDGILPFSVGLWFLGVAIMSLRLASGWAWLQWLQRRPDTVPASDDIQLRLLRLCQRMNLASNIRILLCEKVPGPTVLGWLRPVILLPPAALLGMPPEQLELVLAHELAHILRHDFAINLIQSCVEVLLFYHPAVWWVSAKIRQERELCCDDLAVRTTGDALDYAAALTRLEALCRPPVPPRHAAQALALSATGGSFMHRIRRLVSPIASTPLAPRAGLVLLLVIGLAIGLQAAQTKAESTKIETSRELLLRRFNTDNHEGMAKAGQITFDGVKLTPAFGLRALDQLAALPVNGSVTELRLPIPPQGEGESKPLSFNFQAIDPAYLRRVLEGQATEKSLSTGSCPRYSVILRRFDVGTPQLSPLPGKTRLSVVANEADIELVSAALRELMDMKPTPYLYQRIQKTLPAPTATSKALTIELDDANPDEFRMILDAQQAEKAKH